jgi:protein-tyrosine phosphatase
MIDIHAHFLSGMDDGAKTVDESIAMLDDVYKQGVTLCAGTSHLVLHKEECIESFIKRRDNAIALLEKALCNSNTAVPKLFYGAEIYLDNDISEFDGLEKLCLTDTNLLLVEFPVKVYKPEYSEWIYSLTLRGIVPVIAHIERYPYVNELINELDSVNVVYQTNAKAVIKNSWFKRILELYCNGRYVVVSSDMHNIGLRKSYMKKAYDKVCKHYSKEVADDLFENNAAKLI